MEHSIDWECSYCKKTNKAEHEEFPSVIRRCSHCGKINSARIPGNKDPSVLEEIVVKVLNYSMSLVDRQYEDTQSKKEAFMSIAATMFSHASKSFITSDPAGREEGIKRIENLQKKILEDLKNNS